MKAELLEFLLCPHTKSSLKLETYERHGEEIESGVLHSEAGAYPIIAGIPMLVFGQTELLELIRAGHYQEATALAVIGSAPADGLWRVTKWLQETYRLKGLGKKLEQPRQNEYRRQVQEALFPADKNDLTTKALLTLAFRQRKIRSPEVFNYSYYRYSLPNHLVAFAFASLIGGSKQPVLDLACGLGHITRYIQVRAAPQPTVGLDGFFFYLYAARTHIACEAWFVCGDVNNLPFRDGVFSTVFCSDAFHNFQNKWSNLREMERVLAKQGALMLIWLYNSLHKHLYPARPLTPDGYRSLIEGLAYRMIPDSLTWQNYLRKQGLAVKDQVSNEVLNSARTLSILAYKGESQFQDAPAFQTWPHATGNLGVNPLYIPDSTAPDHTTYARHFPSTFYADENPEMVEYLPESFTLSSAEQTFLSEHNDAALEKLIQCCAIMGFPAGYLD